ncbi:hypothetical protein FisN_12Hh308 [Fistulifera solaris]|uniref:SET domain-containing protein n=1 Tax=Fistulifera solaris TaxID=1519565 RepID=A0A1Z5KCB2_FISSO|nr:hypothetical protein FisN_12Hh308 [Fistulifera solaris]|eukprot:GAX23731.1 hypothetical protein FisN_12Hh308 [Fistulifera solaris]
MSALEEEKTKPASNAEKRETGEKQVRFSENAKTDPSSKQPYSRRIVVAGKGKGNGKPIRDIGIFIAIFVVLMFITRDFEKSVVNNSDEDDDAIVPQDPIANKLNKLANAFIKLAQSEMDSKPFRKEPCDIFLRLGTIPKTGYSLFAGRNYTQDEMIPIPGLEISRWFPIRDDQSHNLNVAPHGFLLKHHPLQTNVQGMLMTETDMTQSVSVRATRDIREGEELFVDFHQHPAKFLTSHSLDPIPSPEDHEIAREIRTDVKLTGKRLVHGQRKKSVKINPAPLLAMMQRSMEKVRPQVAALLHHETVYESLLYHHKVNSVCPSDVVVVDSTSVRTRYAVSKGDKLTVIPLQRVTTTKEEEENQLPNWASHCISVKNESQIEWYCPLTMSTQHLITAPDNSPHNVELNWVEHEGLHARNDLFAWKIVALQDLPAGAEINFSKDWKDEMFV